MCMKFRSQKNKSTQEDKSNNNHLNSHSLSKINSDKNQNYFQEFNIDLTRSSTGSFGFSIIGGTEDSSPITIGYIEKGGSADCDGRLKLNDIILQVNGTTFVGISHKKALLVFKNANTSIKMTIQREASSKKDRSEMFSKLANIDNQVKNTEKEILNSKRTHYTNNKPTNEFDIGIYKDLEQRTERGGDLKIYHLIPNYIACRIIPEYNEEEAICIVLRQSKRRPIRASCEDLYDLLLSMNETKKILASAIGCNIQLKPIPGPVLLEAIRQHCQRFPYIYAKIDQNRSNMKANLITCNGNELAILIPFIDLKSIGNIEDILRYGNCVKDLPLPIYYFLVEKKMERSMTRADYDDLSEIYVVHRDINPFTNKPRCLTIQIEFDSSDIEKEETDKYIKSTKTYHYNIISKYK
ncbi:hypothetical protein I4U23_022469 [Adineta vaga]|nr:hypothetical protein I4U23_022469 [Adineta vaga]